MKKMWLVVIVVVLVVGGGVAYLMMHKTKNTAASNTKSGSNQSQSMAINNAVLMSMNSSSVGAYLADPSGKTLYTYDNDTSGVSNCTGSCLSAWPAYVDKGATTGLPTDVGTITRSDNGQVQYTYKGLPLYYFASDPSGKVTGNGVSSFTVAKP